MVIVQGNNEDKMKEHLYIIKYNLSTKKKLFNLIVYGDNDYALKEKNKLLFFCEFQQAYKYWVKNKLSEKYTLQKKIALTCDIPLALKIIEKNKMDKNSVVLNCINTFDDLFKTLNLGFPLRFKKSLYAFADHLTFKKEISSFFTSRGYRRDFLIQGLLRLEGIIIENMIVSD
ncbi:MAG: hypothetical protein DAHOPDDO_00809 [Ignavibacteriaceae bacterium]|nr:hypothetical protein [Ignavibacteriaceae bacterium]